MKEEKEGRGREGKGKMEEKGEEDKGRKIRGGRRKEGRGRIFHPPSLLKPRSVDPPLLSCINDRPTMYNAIGSHKDVERFTVKTV